jgi:hypothetical protein
MEDIKEKFDIAGYTFSDMSLEQFYNSLTKDSHDP